LTRHFDPCIFTTKIQNKRKRDKESFWQELASRRITVQ
jgi:hypothetical protein